MNNEEIKSEFTKKRIRQIAITGALFPIISLIWFPAFFAKYLGIEVDTVSYSGLALVILGFGLSVWNFRCPNCKKYLGNSFNPKKCPKCAVELYIK